MPKRCTFWIRICKVRLCQICTLRKNQDNFMTKKPTKNNMEDIESEIDLLLRTKSSKIAYNNISSITILHLKRRDIGIMTCFRDSDNNIHIGNDITNDSCLKILL